MKIVKKCLQLPKRIINKVKSIYYREKYKKEILELIQEINKKNQKSFIFFNVVDWNIPLFQRPQHIAKCLAEQGVIYIYLAGNIYDDTKIYEKKHENLYIVNVRFKNIILENLKVQNKYIQLYSTDMKISNEYIDSLIDKKYTILYEYIDEISAELYGKKIPKKAWEKHQRILKDTNIYIACTARKLYEEVYKIRKDYKLALITNGVDYKHFNENQKSCPLKELINKEKPIIGYFGALAKWFDYELIEELAKRRPQYEILLIGWSYDDSLSRSSIRNYSNVTVIGPIDYQILPQYAKWFNVSIIPFEINEITESTSPIKLFEYMALGHPIVTTDMPECRLYESVLIGENKDDFIKQIDKGISLQDNQEYLNIVYKEAKANIWESKATQILSLLEGSEI